MRHFHTLLSLLGIVSCLTLLPACSSHHENEIPDNEDNNTPEETTSTEDEKLNQIVYDFLSDYYLWNDEYKAQTLDFSKAYQQFFEDGLMSLKTNTLDRRYNEAKEKYYLFSYIKEVPDYSSTRATGSNLYKKEKEMSFGLIGLFPFIYKTASDGNDYVPFMVRGVYPGSPADKAGLSRGDFIQKWDGKDIRISNWQEIWNAMMYPTTAATHTVESCYVNSDNTLSNPTTKTMTCAPLELNPVLKAQVETVSGHKVGYLFYTRFDGGYDQELLDELKQFKQEGITDLVLDLRYNLGGHVVSANLLATCIAGSACEGKAFVEYRFNDTRMKALGNKRKVELFGEKLSDDALKSQLADCQLNLSRLYVIVSDETASASELVINALEGIDLDLFLIGTTTMGKNVGMEVITVGKGEVKGNDLEKKYQIAPITFQTYNAKGFGDYEKGFLPNMEVDESNIFNQERILTVYQPLGTQKEYLYAFALEQITGETIIKRPSASTRGIASLTMEQWMPLPLPARSERGMVTRWEE